MKAIHTLAVVLLIVGALNWGLVAIAEFDLVALLFADGFGTTSPLSRIVYGLVGVSAVYHGLALAGVLPGDRETEPVHA